MSVKRIEFMKGKYVNCFKKEPDSEGKFSSTSNGHYKSIEDSAISLAVLAVAEPVSCVSQSLLILTEILSGIMVEGNYLSCVINFLKYCLAEQTIIAAKNINCPVYGYIEIKYYF